MTENLQEQTKEEKLKELLYIHDRVEITHIPNNVYRIVDYEDGTHLILDLGKVKSSKKERNPLIFIPSVMFGDEATIIEFKNGKIETTGPEEDRVHHTLLLAKATLETVLTWREIPQEQELSLAEDEEEAVSKLGPREIPNHPSTTSGYEMLKIINQELSHDS